MNKIMASIAGVKKTYDDKTFVVNGIDLDLYQNEFLTFLGPSGSGKTTTLMMLAGFEHPTSGSIAINGVETSRVPPQKRNIGMVFQNYALFPHMTVSDNIGYPLRVRGVPKAEIAQKVKRILDTVRLPQVYDRKPSQLSGGQQQRIALARALVFNPTIVLMDEPLGALDKQLREEMQYEIRALQQNLGLTVVYVTHDQTEALTMSDRVAVFNHGVIAQLASPAELYEQPVSAFVAGFVGDTNFLEGTAIGRDQEFWQVRLSGGDIVSVRSHESLAADKKVTIAVRPERVAILPKTAVVDAAVPATIVEVVYLGDQLRIVLRLSGGQSLSAKVANSHDTIRFGRNDNVLVSWRSADARIYS